MFSMIASLVTQIIGGAIGGATFARFTQFSLGGIGDAISGAVGGVLAGQLFQALIPGFTGGEGLDISSLLVQLAVGGAGGAIVTALVSLLMNPIDY